MGKIPLNRENMCKGPEVEACLPLQGITDKSLWLKRGWRREERKRGNRPPREGDLQGPAGNTKSFGFLCETGVFGKF